MGVLTADRLVAACGDGGLDAGISITTVLEPLAGPGAPVKPAVYEGGKYQHDVRWWGEGAQRVRTPVIVIDNAPSQANRLEAALQGSREVLGLPELVLDLSGIKHLPPQLPRQLSSFLFPHRNADAYLRDAELDGIPFDRTDLGRRVFDASADRPEALFEFLPQALLFGFWQSHLGKKRAQTKLARSWVSEIIGLDPATDETTLLGLKGDPLNLSIDVALDYDEDDLLDWKVTEGAKAGRGKSKDSLAEIGHGQVPVAGGAAGVSFRAIVQQSSVSFAGLRRIRAATPQASAAGRALLVAIGLAAHAGAFGRAFSLRSGCDLRPSGAIWLWRGESGDEPLQAPSLADMVDLVRACAGAAEAEGLPVGSRWPAPLVLVPQRKLVSVIEKSYPDLGTV